jgi:hypothetical protein
MVWKNQTNEDVEAELVFPLASGATVCKFATLMFENRTFFLTLWKAEYAIDIDGALVDGVVVEKETARSVFGLCEGRMGK